MDKNYYDKNGNVLGDVLAEYPSESEPGKWYQVRTSHRDGKTYCTCRGWVQALNKMRYSGLKGEAECKHIKEYRRQPAAKPIVIMDFEAFASVRRGIPLNLKGKVSDEVKVRRQ